MQSATPNTLWNYHIVAVIERCEINQCLMAIKITAVFFHVFRDKQFSKVTRCQTYIFAQWSAREDFIPPPDAADPMQGHLQYMPGCTTLCGWLIHSFFSVIKIFLQYFSIEDTHFMNESFIKISRTFVKSGAVEGLALCQSCSPYIRRMYWNLG